MESRLQLQLLIDCLTPFSVGVGQRCGEFDCVGSVPRRRTPALFTRMLITHPLPPKYVANPSSLLRRAADLPYRIYILFCFARNINAVGGGLSATRSVSVRAVEEEL